MKVLVVGANGQIGKHVVEKLSKNNHVAKAMVRKIDQANEWKSKGIESVVADLEGSVDEIVNAARDVEAIIFTAGSGGGTSDDKTLLIDLDGAAKTIEAAEKLGIERFVMVSAFQANNRENWYEPLKPYYVAKHFADKQLLASTLNYTIIRPGGLTNEPGTGTITIGENMLAGSIPREDVASVVVAALDDNRTYKKSFDLVSGSTSITNSIEQLS
ncbi:SDR family oxidoreductase [Aquibacillus kalidii]|uniref:SDR family oxidoreductase n=1 Tax=Aquibacillus kalidii TaxID=2762597 RepID=UPI0016451141|nr:SDR family oxidoreductase [Aquibacillus kalidii]